MCELTAGCRQPNALVLVHKRAGARPEYRKRVCQTCAARIGRLTGAPLIDAPGRESTCYRLEELTP
jgi:hypothetical protein